MVTDVMYDVPYLSMKSWYSTKVDVEHFTGNLSIADTTSYE